MKVYNFNSTTLSDFLGMEMTLFKSGDINGSWITMRGCMAAVVQEVLGLDDDVVDHLDEYVLEQLLLDNDIYVVFEDDRGGE